MSAENPRIIEAKQAEFISYSEVTRALMELKGDSLANIARDEAAPHSQKLCCVSLRSGAGGDENRKH
jgi:hypothetical protein